VTLSSGGFGGCDSYPDPVDYFVVFGTAGRQAPVPLATITAATDGSFSAVVTIPAETTPGEGYLNFSGSRWDECDDTASCVGYGTTVLITAPTPTTS
jgi:hypothetical protein